MEDKTQSSNFSKCIEAIRKADLTPSQKLILYALATRLGNNDKAWPSLRTLQQDTGYKGRSHLCAQITELINLDILIKTSSDNSNRYSFTDDFLNQVVPIHDHPGTDPLPGVVPIRYQGGTDPLPKDKVNKNYENKVKTNIVHSAQNVNKEENESMAEILEIFEHWKVTLNHPKSKLDDKRKRQIAKALKLNSADELKEAINGCARSPHHMGQNEQSKIYDSIDLIFRSQDKIEGFMQTPAPVSTELKGFNNDNRNNKPKSVAQLAREFREETEKALRIINDGDINH